MSSVQSYQHSDIPIIQLTDTVLQDLLPLDLGRITSATGTSDLGNLQRLPMEMIHLILEHLPLVSLICFRNTSRPARHAVDIMTQFRLIVDQAPQALRGTLAIQTKVWITLPDLVNKLQQRHCDLCGKLAQHLWLPTTKRLCFNCTHYRMPKPLTKEQLIRHYRFTDEDIKYIPSFRFLPFTLENKNGIFRVPWEHTLYDAEVAAELYYNKTRTRILPPGTSFLEDKVNRTMIQKPVNGNRPRIIPPHVVPAECRRNMAMVVAPWISNKGPEMGVFCATCHYTPQQNLIYRPAEFPQHVQICRVHPFDESSYMLRRSLWYGGRLKPVIESR